MSTHEFATLDDLDWADGFAAGSPTRFGGPAAQLKSFLDSTGGLWVKGKLVNKVATSFTTASNAHGGLESGKPYGGSFVSRYVAGGLLKDG
ncbi:NADPH-dependent FMN reductase [Amycolatopsis regifaucium]|nr:NADPH-dependent FMN reductase [Amycolatopsis regifaucium]